MRGNVCEVRCARSFSCGQAASKNISARDFFEKERGGGKRTFASWRGLLCFMPVFGDGSINVNGAIGGSIGGLVDRLPVSEGVVSPARGIFLSGLSVKSVSAPLDGSGRCRSFSRRKSSYFAIAGYLL